MRRICRPGGANQTFDTVELNAIEHRRKRTDVDVVAARGEESRQVNANDVLAGRQRVERESTSCVGHHHGRRHPERGHHRAGQRPAAIVAHAAANAAERDAGGLVRRHEPWFRLSVRRRRRRSDDQDRMTIRFRRPMDSSVAPLRLTVKFTFCVSVFAGFANLSTTLISRSVFPLGKRLQWYPLSGLNALLDVAGSNAAPIDLGREDLRLGAVEFLLAVGVLSIKRVRRLDVELFVGQRRIVIWNRTISSWSFLNLCSGDTITSCWPNAYGLSDCWSGVTGAESCSTRSASRTELVVNSPVE